MSRTLHVEVYFDLICPWCLIGKRQLDDALARWHTEHPQHPVQLNWHGVQLVQGLPPGGLDFVAFYERRLGGPEAARGLNPATSPPALPSPETRPRLPL